MPVMPEFRSLPGSTRRRAQWRCNPYRLVLAAAIALLSGACSAETLGENLMSWDHWTDSAGRAARDNATWMPLAGAAVIAAGGWDRQWQRSLAKHHYLFGEEGEDASNRLLQAGTLLYATSLVFAAPAETPFTDALDWKAANLGAFVASKASVDELAGRLKLASGRERPDGVPDDAFPSRHSATSAAQNTLTRRNLDYIEMDATLRDAAKIGLHTLDGLTGLARIEADQHYPTDVLAGIALGNFVSSFAFNLLLERGDPQSYQFNVVPALDGYALETHFTF
ncbi:phosphatidic acid phosphatase [Stutzerimonas stutzeri]|uniref:Phosphatidic acid phosphatase n=2 Tax=Stutzerimonas stutzeri TaxID=316 RepID=A0A2N8RWZ2_STUST|nr:phosphatidic acid phosphatase [Stutzerimonas stutzeri]